MGMVFHTVQLQKGSLIKWYRAETQRKQDNESYRYLGRFKLHPGQWGCGRRVQAGMQGSEKADVAELGQAHQMC